MNHSCPNFCRGPSCVAHAFPCSATEISKHMLYNFPMCLSWISIEYVQATDCRRDVWSCADRQIHQAADGVFVGDVDHVSPFLCVMGRLGCTQLALQRERCGDSPAVGHHEPEQNLFGILLLQEEDTTLWLPSDLHPEQVGCFSQVLHLKATL